MKDKLTPTPGPWHVGPHYKSDVESRHGRICECGITRGPQAEVNAQLISAAPDLLQACRDTMDYWDSTGFSDCEEGCNCIVDQMRAAIAKATGAPAAVGPVADGSPKG